ncbi:MAG: type II secretion system F family protein [Fimbriimonadales bacterium]
MATFRYVAQTQDGREIRGTLEAKSRLEANDILRREGYWLLELYAEPEARTPLTQANQNVVRPLFGGVPLKAQAVFFRQLATMIGAGVPIFQAMDTLAEQRVHPRLRRTLRAITQSLLAGERLSDAFDRYPHIFSPIVRAMIRVGETGGALEQVLRRVAQYMEDELELRRLLSRVTFYPKLVLFFAILIPGLVPALITMVGAQGGQPVGVVLANIAMTYARILGVVLALWVGFKLAMQSRTLRYAWGVFLVSIPWVGFTYRQLALARFARALSTLYEAGLPLSQAIRYAADACGNDYLTQRLKPTADYLEAGQGIAQSLARAQVLPAMVLDMVATGENTGAIGQMMDKVSEYYEEEGKLRSHQAGYVLGVLVFLGVAIYVAMIVLQFYAGYFSGIMRGVGEP